MYLVQKILPVARTATGWPAGAPFVSGKNSADYRFRPRYLTKPLGAPHGAARQQPHNILYRIHRDS